MQDKKKFFKKYTSILLSGAILLTSLPFGRGVKAEEGEPIIPLETIESIETIEDDIVLEDIVLEEIDIDSSNEENKRKENFVNNNNNINNIKEEFIEDDLEEVREKRITKLMLSGGVNIRTSKVSSNSNNIVGRTYKGQVFSGTVSGSWFRTTYKGQTVYISNKFMGNVNPITVKMKSNANVRNKGTVKSEKIGYITAGTVVTGTKLNNWFRTIYNGKTAYISNKLIDFENSSEVDTPSENTNYNTTKYATHNNVNIRNSNNTNSAIIGKTIKGQEFKGIDKGNWFETTLNGKKVYISNQYLSTSKQNTVINNITKYATHNNVNIRSNNTTDSSILGSTYKGQEFKGIDKGNWFETTFNGKKVYISNQYLSTSKQNTVNNITKYATHSNVNIRSNNTTNSSILGSTYKGQAFKGVNKGNWFETTFNGSKVYISNQYLSTSKKSTNNSTNNVRAVVVTANVLNVRLVSNNQIVGYFEKGDVVHIKPLSKGWGSFYWRGRHVKISTKYVKNEIDTVINNNSNSGKTKYKFNLDPSLKRDHRHAGRLGIIDKKTIGWAVDRNAYIRLERNLHLPIISLNGYRNTEIEGRNYNKKDLVVVQYGGNKYHVKKSDITITNSELFPKTQIDNIPYKYRKYIGSVMITQYTNRPHEYKKHYAYAIGNDLFFNNTSKNFLDVAYHETGHAIDFVYGKLSYQQTWKNIYNKEWKNTNMYGSTNLSESFAESFELYHIDNEGHNLKRNFPESYKYMRDLDKHL